MPEKNGTRLGHVDLITEATRDALTVRRVFGDPIVHGDVTVIPVARVMGGNGIGFGSGAIDARRAGPSAEEGEKNTEGGGQGDGGGGGFGVKVCPLGVFVVTGDDAEWRPTLDVTRVALVGEVVALVAILATAHVVRSTIARRAPIDVAPLPMSARLAAQIPRPRLVRRSVVGAANLVSALLSRRP